MHHLMLITLNRPAGAASQDTRERVRTLLIDDDSFCGQGGRFGAPLCDWFVIGGRWSGHLQQVAFGERYQAAFKRTFPKVAQTGLSSAFVESHHAALNRLWRRCGGTGSHPATRSGYDDLGSHDDAMIVDHRLYDRLLAEFKGESECAGHDSRPDFADLDGDPVDESFVGRKWVAVVDYHN
jgi:hypothetical protein